MSGKHLDHVVVVDVESTCWDGAPPAGQESEIIDVGVCLLDVATGERLERESMLVRPRLSSVSSCCQQLTGIGQADVEQGLPFEEACAVLAKRFKCRERIWASYGDYDRRQFERQCARDGVRYPFGPTHVNVKALFALVRGLPAEVGMSEALEFMGLPLEGRHHRGGDDAWNIAAILSRIMLTARPAVSARRPYATSR